MITSMIMKWVRHVANARAVSIPSRSLIAKSERKRSPESLWLMLKTESENGDQIYLTKGRDQWQDVLNTVYDY
jgi:hypothetical protein